MNTIQEGVAPSDKYRVPVRNTSSETIPPYGAMQVASSSLVGDDKVFNVIKPNGAPGAKVYLNGPAEIPVSEPGHGTDEYPAEALITGTVVFGAEIGPVNASWALTASGKGFQFLGGLAGGVGRVAAKGGTTAGDDFPLIKILNVSGLPKAFGSIVGYGLPVDPPPGTLHRIPTFQSVAPTKGKPFAVLLQDIATSAVGDAGPCGVVPVQIDYTDAAHTKADAITNDYAKLRSGAEGPAIILWREKQGISGSGTLGVQWARVLLDRFEATTVISEDIRGVSAGGIGAATGSRDGPLTPGVGNARLYNPPASGNAGVAWQVGQIVSVENWMRGTIPDYKPLLLRPSRLDDNDNTIYTVIAEGCAEIPSQEQS